MTRCNSYFENDITSTVSDFCPVDSTRPLTYAYVVQKSETGGLKQIGFCVTFWYKRTHKCNIPRKQPTAPDQCKSLQTHLCYDILDQQIHCSIMDSRDNKRRKGDDSASISHDADGTDTVPNEEDQRAEDDIQPQHEYEEIAAASDDNNKLLPERDEQQREANRRRARDIRKRKKKMVAEMQLKIAQLTMENQLLIQRTQMQQTVIEQLRANIQQQGTVQQLVRAISSLICILRQYARLCKNL